MTDYAKGRADALVILNRHLQKHIKLERCAASTDKQRFSRDVIVEIGGMIDEIEALAQQPQPPLDEAEALIDEAYDERDKWLFKYRDAVRLIMEINQFLASKGIVHPTKLSNQIISTIKDATEHIGSLAQQPQDEDEKPLMDDALLKKMSDNVTKLDDHRPHMTFYGACMACGRDVVVVCPVGTKNLECAHCHKPAVERVQIHDAEWFDRYMNGAKTKKQRDMRTMVLLNAKRMGL